MAISLYEELNSYLKNSEYWYEEYWYEEGSGKVSEILSKFTQDDWNKLTKLKTKYSNNLFNYYLFRLYKDRISY